MTWRILFLLGAFLLPCLSLLADGLTDALDANAPNNSKESSDHRIRFTILYIGAYKPTTFQPFLAGKKFVITYLVEDRRSAEDAERNPGMSAGGQPTAYYLRCVQPEAKDGHHQLMTGGSLDQMPFALSSKPVYKEEVANLKLPQVEFPERAWIYQYLFTAPADGPFDLVFHDYMPAYGQTSVHFGNVDPGSLPSP